MTVEKTTADLMARIDERLGALGLSDRQASLQATGTASSIRNIRRGSEPPASVLAKIAGVLQTSPSYLAFGEQPPGIDAVIDAGNQVYLLEAKQHKPQEAPANIPLIGRAAPGSYFVKRLAYVDESRNIPADPDYPAEHQFAVEVEGSLIERVAPAGSIAGCVRLKEERIHPRTGDLVVVETHDALDRFERTVRKLVEAGDHIELHGDTADPEFQAPMIVRDGKNEAGEAVELIGLVTWVHMPVRRRGSVRRI